MLVHSFPKAPAIAKLKDYPFDRLASLLKDVPCSPFTSSIYKGQPIIASIGEPQLSPPSFIKELLVQDLESWGKYPPVLGTDELRLEMKNYLCRRFKLENNSICHHQMILPVSGTREGLYSVAQLVRDIGKKLALIPNPFYLVYEAAAFFADLEPVYLNTSKETKFLPDLDAISHETWEQCGIFYFCSPSNPQGKSADLDYLKRLIQLARRYHFILVVDECYSEIYNQTPPPGALEALKELQGQEEKGFLDLSCLMIFHSLSKRSSAAGLRSGFVCGDPHLMSSYKKMRAYSHAGMPFAIQEASKALWKDQAHVIETRLAYQKKFEIADHYLASKFGLTKPDGGFFVWLNVGDGEKATHKLWSEVGIKVLPGAYLAKTDPHTKFNPGDEYIRIALVHADDVVEYICQKVRDLL